MALCSVVAVCQSVGRSVSYVCCLLGLPVMPVLSWIFPSSFRIAAHAQQHCIWPCCKHENWHSGRHIFFFLEIRNIFAFVFLDLKPNPEPTRRWFSLRRATINEAPVMIEYMETILRRNITLRKHDFHWQMGLLVSQIVEQKRIAHGFVTSCKKVFFLWMTEVWIVSL